jgi:CheY-like chemotaxis protein
MLTRSLRRQERWQKVPIIATTANAFPEDRLNALQAGCNAYLAKPFNARELLSMMDDLFLPSCSGSPSDALLQ